MVFQSTIYVTFLISCLGVLPDKKFETFLFN